MKTLAKLTFILIFLSAGLNTSYAQNKRADKTAKIKALMNAQNYIFEATYAIPQRGGSRSLNYNYDLVVSRDTVIAYLPYFGRAMLAPSDPSDGGIKFTSTSFDYKTEPGKNGSYNITITPRQMDVQGSKDVRYLRLNVSSSGYASLQVISNNRDPISFNGNIVERKPKK